MNRTQRNILVLDGRHSNETLGALGLVNRHNDAFPDTTQDSCRAPNLCHPGLVTVDGMQVFRFRDRFPYEGEQGRIKDPPRQDPNHLEYWMRRLEDELQASRLPGSKMLDAVVIPSAIGRLRPERLDSFLHRLRERWPAVKIVQLSQQEFAPHPLVDRTMFAHDTNKLSDVVREMIDMPKLPVSLPPAVLEENRRIADRLKRDGIDPETFRRGPRRPGRTRRDANDMGDPPRGRG